MSRVVVAAGIVGLLLFVEPPLDGLAGYLLFQEGHRIVGTIVLSVNAVIAAGVLLSFLPKWFHLIIDDDTIWVCANQADEIVVIEPTQGTRHRHLRGPSAQAD